MPHLMSKSRNGREGERGQESWAERREAWEEKAARPPRVTAESRFLSCRSRTLKTVSLFVMTVTNCLRQTT